MHGFVCKKDFSINVGKFIRHYKGITSLDNIPVEHMYIDCGGESRALYDALKKDAANADLPEQSLVALIQEFQLITWAHFPVRLGRVSAKLVGESLHMHEEAEPLKLQLDILKSKHPNKKHFRFAVINAYGTNLGDATIGATAMRYVATVLQAYLGSIAIDVYLGVQANPTNADISAYEPWVAQVHFDSPSVQKMARYDAYFDFTNLINLPKMLEMPIVDWYLWWMGVDPALVAEENKRNRLTIKVDAWQSVSALLKTIKGHKRVLFNPKASVPLRSCAPEIAAELVLSLLTKDETLTLVIDQALDVSHERLVNLSGKIDSAHKFMALVAQLDGVITVDTFASHAADAMSTPTVLIFSSLPKSIYPYYPFCEGIELPEAHTLPAWKMFKHANHEDWLTVKPSYDDAWRSLDIDQVLASLSAMIEKRKLSVRLSLPPLVHESHHYPVLIRQMDRNYLRHDYSSAIYDRAHQRLSEIAQAFIKPGMSVLCITPGTTHLPLILAKQVSSLGRLELFEPRHLRRAIISNAIFTRYPVLEMLVHDAVPIKDTNSMQMNRFDGLGESNPAEWGNLREQEGIKALPIDSQSLTRCEAIFFLPPMQMSAAVNSGLETIRRLRPALLFAPINKKEAEAVVRMLKDDDYQFWAESALGTQDYDQMLLLAFKNEQNVNLQGFKQIKLA